MNWKWAYRVWHRAPTHPAVLHWWVWGTRNRRPLTSPRIALCWGCGPHLAAEQKWQHISQRATDTSIRKIDSFCTWCKVWLNITVPWWRSLSSLQVHCRKEPRLGGSGQCCQETGSVICSVGTLWSGRSSRRPSGGRNVLSTTRHYAWRGGGIL